MPYKFIDNITSDVLFEVEAPTLKDLFTDAAHALFEVICKIDQVQPKEEVNIEVTGTDEEDLMINWLQSLIANVDIEEKFFSKFTITEITPTNLKAIIAGEPISPEKGETVVKAVTYHQYKLEKKESGFLCRVSLDI